MTNFNSWEKGLFSVVGLPGGPESTDTTYWYRRDENPKINKNSPYGDTDITYVWNRHGFRSDEFNVDDREAILVLGCSLTIGIGCPLEHTWPQILKNKIDPHLKVYNISMGAASSDFVSRALYKTIDALKPKAVFILWPSHSARELAFKGRYLPYKVTALDSNEYQTNSKKFFNLFTPLLSDYSYFIYQQRKNEILAESICNERKIPISHITASIEEDLSKPNFLQIVSNLENFNNEKAGIRRIGYQFDFPLARDNFHFGREANEYVADILYQKYLINLSNT